MSTSKDGFTKVLAEFISTADASEIPAEIYEHGKYALLDYLAVTIAGANEPLVKILIDNAKVMGGNPQATIIGHGQRQSVAHAAMINGAASHVLDYDDTLESFFGHPSATIFPALLALADWKELSGRDLLTAYLVGLQVGTVVGSSAGLAHYMAGWHATSTIGHFASAAACARLLQLSTSQTQFALGIAGTRSAGLKRVFGSMCKSYHAGLAAEAGLVGALLAQNGFDSAPDILEGDHGFFKCMKGEPNIPMIAQLGNQWEVVNLAQKYHASCHATHSPIEAVLALVEENKLDIDSVKTIRISVSQLSLDAAGQMEPKTGLQGKFSIPFCVANALVSGVTDSSAFTDERVNAVEIVNFMKKIIIHLDTNISAVGAAVQVEMFDGSAYSKVFDIFKQIPVLEVKRVKIKRKYNSICSPLLGHAAAEALAESVIGFDRISNVNRFFTQGHCTYTS